MQQENKRGLVSGGTLHAHCGASRHIYTQECTNTAYTCIQYTHKGMCSQHTHTLTQMPSEHTHITHMNALATFSQHTQTHKISFTDLRYK